MANKNKLARNKINTSTQQYLDVAEIKQDIRLARYLRDFVASQTTIHLKPLEADDPVSPSLSGSRCSLM